MIGPADLHTAPAPHYTSNIKEAQLTIKKALKGSMDVI
jgi:hypothetical protein